SAVERFQQEVRAAARLHHPHIVTAFDADQAGGLHFLVMEYVEGQSLAEVVAERGPLPVAEACAYVRQAALGLQHAHQRGRVHRDSKPHTLMVTAGGQVKILDFGLARLARAPEDTALSSAAPASALTGAGVVMGTADYIAPEQAADPRAADIRADIYSLGCTLFHLLTGRPPFPEGSVQEKIAKHLTGQLPPLSPEVPPALAEVVAKMTAKDPAQRYAAPAAVAEALAPFACGAGFQPAAAVQEAGWKPAPRKRVALALLGVAAAIIAAVVIVRVTTERGDIVVHTD